MLFDPDRLRSHTACYHQIALRFDEGAEILKGKSNYLLNATQSVPYGPYLSLPRAPRNTSTHANGSTAIWLQECKEGLWNQSLYMGPWDAGRLAASNFSGHDLKECQGKKKTYDKEICSKLSTCGDSRRLHCVKIASAETSSRSHAIMLKRRTRAEDMKKTQGAKSAHRWYFCYPLSPRHFALLHLTVGKKRGPSWNYIMFTWMDLSTGQSGFSSDMCKELWVQGQLSPSTTNPKQALGNQGPDMSILPQYDQILQSSGIHLCGTRTLTVSKGWHWHIGHSSPARR